MRRLKKVEFDVWYKDILLRGLDRVTALRWFHSIPKPVVNNEGKVVFHTPYAVMLLPHNQCVMPTGYQVKGENYELMLNLFNHTDEIISLGQYEPVTEDKVSVIKIMKWGKDLWLS